MLLKFVCVYWILSIKIVQIDAWDSDDLELFDLVEEVNENFYKVMNLEKTASSSDIRRAYRKLSLQYHPDKNKEDGAEQKFRQIVAIAEVLKDEVKRQKYDEVLVNGLPDWRQPVYYYRRVRKMGFIELALFLFILITVGQFLFLWSVYWEKKFEIEEVFTSRFRKKDRKVKKSRQTVADDSVDDMIAEELNHLPKPKIQDLLPFQIVYLIIFIIKSLWSMPELYQRSKELITKRFAEESDDNEDEDEIDQPGRVRKPRKRHTVDLPEYSSCATANCLDQDDSMQIQEMTSNVQNDNSDNVTSTWTELDNVALMKAMKKFPGGCTDRWDKIAECTNKPVLQVTKMAKKMKTSSFVTSVPTSIQGVTGNNQNIIIEAVGTTDDSGRWDDEREKIRKRKSQDKESKNINESFDANGSVENSPADSWSQQQQRTLELALQQFPKGTDQRWDRIAACVPDKSKEECMIRFKMLAELVKRKKGVKNA